MLLSNSRQQQEAGCWNLAHGLREGRSRWGEQGRFATEHVTVSIFPNWTGLSRDTGRIRETVDGDTMVEARLSREDRVLESAAERRAAGATK